MMVEAHFFHKDFVRCLDLSVDNSNCHHSNCLRPMSVCAYLDRTEVHRSDVELSAHSIHPVSFDYHLELLPMALKTLYQFDQRYRINRAGMMDRACAYPDAQPLIAVDWFARRSHADCSQYAIYYPANKVNSLNASTEVGMCSTDRSTLHFHSYYQRPIMVLGMISKSS